MVSDRGERIGLSPRLPFLFLALGAVCAMYDERATASPGGPVNWPTRSLDNARSSANMSETTLDRNVVGGKTSGVSFGSSFVAPLDDTPYAQPLYVSNVPLNTPTVHSTQNVLFVATANNKVRALDALTGGLYWTFDPGVPVPTSAQVSDGQGCTDEGTGHNGSTAGSVGTMSTPVIDTSANVMYLVTHTLEGCPPSGCTFSNMTYKLRKLDITTGAETMPPAVIATSGFDPSAQNQRASLAFDSAHSAVYIGFSSYCDNLANTYHGYLFSYDSGTLTQLAAQNTTPSGRQGGVWQSGQAPAIDQYGNVYFATGNGSTDLDGDMSETLLAEAPRTLNQEGAFQPASPYPANPPSGPCPSNGGPPYYLNCNDLDLGVSGPTIINMSGVTQVLQGSKTGTLFSLVFNSVGKFANSAGDLVQYYSGSPADWRNAENHNVVYAPQWNISPNGPSVYVASDGDYVRGLYVNTAAATIGSQFAVASSLPKSGGGMSYSANASVNNTGILWVTSPGGNNWDTTSRTIYALNADTLANIWSASLGQGRYWNPPVIANGMVYAAFGSSGAKGVDAFGSLLSYRPNISQSNPSLKPMPIPIPMLAASGGLLRSVSAGGDGALYYRSRTSGPWGIPTAITATAFAPTAGTSVALGQQTASVTDAVVAGVDGAVHVISSSNNGPWGTPFSVTTTSFVPPGAAIATANYGGQFGVFVVGATGALQIVWWNPVLGWLGPVALTAAQYAVPGADVATAVRSNGELDAFSVGSDGALKYMAFNGSVWSGPYVLSATNFAPIGASVAAAMDVNGYTNVFVIANDGALYTKWDLTPFWSGPILLLRRDTRRRAAVYRL